MLYYADALPPYATKLLRIDAPATDDIVDDWEAWKDGKCERWHPRHGWRPYCGGKMEIMATGDWDQIDPDEVVQVQANAVAAYGAARNDRI
jgi:hypothetical protein